MGSLLQLTETSDEGVRTMEIFVDGIAPVAFATDIVRVNFFSSERLAVTLVLTPETYAAFARKLLSVGLVPLN